MGTLYNKSECLVQDFSAVCSHEGQRGLSGNKDGVFHKLKGKAF